MQKKECIEIFERYIQNSANEDEIKRLGLWIRNNQKISLWLEQQISASSSTMDKEVQMRMLKNIEAEIDVNINNDVIPETKRKIRTRINTWLRVAALFLLPVITAAGMYMYMSRNTLSPAPLIVTVERGQKANITLPDGSKVWLNSQSKLTYSPNFNVKTRELLLDGEAFFEVAHNPEKPFIVRSNDIAVEALGTAFGVKAYNEDNLISSILLRGKVRVTTPDGESILKPNERIMYDKTTRKKIKSRVINSKDFKGWIHNELRYENVSLEDIAKDIQRIYNVNVLFANERLKNQRFTGSVNNNSLESMLSIITLTSPVSFHVKDQQVTFYENKRLLDHFNP